MEIPLEGAEGSAADGAGLVGSGEPEPTAAAELRIERILNGQLVLPDARKDEGPDRSELLSRDASGHRDC
jgi:hypothetical protein